MKVVYVDRKPTYSIKTDVQNEILEKAGIEYVVEECTTEEEAIAKCKDADAIIDVYLKITPKVIESLENCKCIIRTGIGFDSIDVPAATKKGIFVCNCPDYCIEEVATHTVAQILAISRKLNIFNDSIKSGVWRPSNTYAMHRLSNCTLGLVSLGNIAKMVAEYMKGFGTKIIAYDPFLPDEEFEKRGVKKVDLDELFAQSDIISLHAPLTAETKHLINKESISKMKDGVLIVNTSRGPLICEEDLIEAVKSGKINAAALDVVEFEPINEANYRLFESGRIIVSPHMAFSSVEATHELSVKTAETARDIVLGNFSDTLIRRIVNRKDLQDKLK